MLIRRLAFACLLAAGCGGTVNNAPSSSVGKADSLRGAGPLRITIRSQLCDADPPPDTETFLFNGARTSVVYGAARANVDADGRFAMTASWLGNGGFETTIRGHLVGRTLSVDFEADYQGDHCYLTSGVGVLADGSVDQAIVDAVARNGGVTHAGEPLDVQVGAAVHRWNDANVQDLQGGAFRIAIHADGATSAFLVAGPVFDAFYAGGGPGVLGWPVEDARSIDGYSLQRFANGYVRANGQGGYVAVAGPLVGAPGLMISGVTDGALADCYTRNGGAAAVGLAIEAGGSVFAHRWNDSWVQDFDGGANGRGICMHGVGPTGNWATTQAFYVYGDFWGAYWDDGHGALGYPTADARPWQGHLLQPFEHGYIAWDAASGAYKGFPGVAPNVPAVGDDGSGNIDAAIVSCHDGQAGWGPPADAGRGASVFRWGATNAQAFSTGTLTTVTVYCIHPDGDSRAYAVWGGMGDWYVAQGGPSSWLGAPLDDPYYVDMHAYPPFHTTNDGGYSYFQLENAEILWEQGTGYYTR